MKVIGIVGENYAGQWTKARTACRAVVVRDGQILLSCETKHDVWTIPMEDALEIFGSHQSYAGTDEDRRGMYFREYTALCEAPKRCVPLCGT